MNEDYSELTSKVRAAVSSDQSNVHTPHPELFTKWTAPQLPKKTGHINEEQVQQFFSEGYTIVKDYFTAEELQPCRDAVGDLVEELAQKLYKAGKIPGLYKEYGVFQRLTKLEEVYPGANILLFKQGQLHKAFMDLWSCEKFINLAEQILGPDVAGHPVWNLRVKTPNNEATTVPWHQDAAYFSEDSYDHMILTAWVPFLDTNSHNGGMQVMKNSHATGRVAKHTCCHLGFWYVMLEEEDMEKTLGVDCESDLVTCEVPYGGFLLFNNLTAHRSLPNFSNDVRWSVDLRWQSPHHKWGFYDIAEGVLFRDRKQGDVNPDWKKFLSINRKEVWQRMHFDKVLDSDPFDTTVTGPWIGRWELVNHNRHTEAFVTNKKP